MITPVKSKSFGPIWKTMLLIATGYPDAPTVSERKLYKAFYSDLFKVMPCSACRNYIKNILSKRWPLDFYSGHVGLIKSIYKWKRHVNAKLGTSDKSITFDIVLGRYEKLFAKGACSKTCK